MRKLVTIRIDAQIWQTARELGLNISKVCENALKFYISRLSPLNYPNLKETHFDGAMVRPPGFEPGSSAWQADVLDQARLRPPIIFNFKFILKSFTFGGEL